jgi:hypothetical protein
MKDTSEYLEMAIKNIQDDREITRELLDDVVQFMSKDEQRHKEVGITAAKYVETLQRSNEQLVKVAALMQKKETASASLTDFDKNELFEMINGGAQE